MDKRWFFILPFFLLFAACGDDEPELPEDAIEFSYDGENLTAPTLPEGLYEFAARFPSSLTSREVGRAITQVSFYLTDIPAELCINFSIDQTSTIPTDPIYGEIISNLQAGAWNTVTLQQPFVLDGSSVWVGIKVVHDRQQQSVGCDAGPAFANGDWLYDEATFTWETFTNRTGGAESVNWNIKAIVQ